MPKTAMACAMVVKHLFGPHFHQAVYTQQKPSRRSFSGREGFMSSCSWPYSTARRRTFSAKEEVRTISLNS